MKCVYRIYYFLQTPQQYEQDYNKMRGSAEYSKFHGFAYDGIWVIATTLQRAMDSLKRMGHAQTIRDFTYMNKDLGQIFLDSMNETNFFGVTVSIYFIIQLCAINVYLFGIHMNLKVDW